VEVKCFLSQEQQPLSLRQGDCMKVTATLNVHEDNALALYQAVKPDEMQGERSSFTVQQENDKVVFFISAQDIPSLRATLNAITQKLSVFESMQKV
jgi:tRNA threonylcarbamoyladenosine modification (KEOPS) complex  Pcc1 subunit